MIKRKKQLLGAFGLGTALVALAFACILPSQIDSAHAEEVDINVTVQGPGSKVTIITPADESVVARSTLDVTTEYTKIQSLDHTLVCKKDGAEVVNTVIDHYTPDSSATSGRRSFSKSLEEYNLGNEADCTLRAKAVSAEGGDLEDVVTFRYRSLKVVMNDKVNDAGNPSATITIRDDVTLIVAQVYDAQGKPVFTKGGADAALSIPNTMFDAEKGQYVLTLPMAEHDAKAGNYTLVVRAYNKEGKNVSTNTVHFNYVPKGSGPVDPDDPNRPVDPDDPSKPSDPSNPSNPDKPGNVPEVPGTGSILGDMNIAKFDYILTGLVAFGAVAAFAAYLMVRARRREK